MAYRMIIADDEKMLIQLIKKLGKFRKLDIEIVDECCDGEQAYLSILKHRPDFVLTDIQMPIFDGLEVIEKVQRDIPDMLFVLISGFRYFDYARSAIQLNVVDYLLKPVIEDQLNALLVRLCRLTDERRKQKQENESLQSLRASMDRKKTNEFWKMILSEETTQLQDGSLKEQFGIEFKYPCFRMLVLNYSLSQLSETGRFSFSDKLNEIAGSAFDGRVKHYCYEWDNQYAVLLNFAQEQLGVVRTATSIFFYGCKDLHEIFGDFRMTLGLSDVHQNVAQLGQVAEEAQAASWGWLYFNGDQIIRYDQVRKMPHITTEELFSVSQIQRLKDCIRYLKKEELKEVFAEIKYELGKLDYVYPADVGRSYNAICRQLSNEAVESCRENLLQRCSDALKRAWNPAQMFENAFLVFKNYIEEQMEVLARESRNPVKRAKEYICQNYQQSLSLEIVADAVGVSNAYLSRVFKEISGIGFNEYLTNVRMDKSKELLAETDLSIRDIAFQIGYSNEKYYSKLFKKLFGIKPTEYRRLYG